MNPLGKSVKKLRESRGWNQEQLGARLGVKGGYVSLIETGTRVPRPPMMEKLMDIFGVDEMTIRFGERQPPEPASPERQLVDAELADLSSTALLEVAVILRKWKLERSQFAP